ncbi:PA3496 family putative envelope integrity protein [Azomonas macrocytogenes]|uniref:Leucyl-tRNA synthetase n=1 Tax=Azomonas macrocytogenes TaxID=69962 RepID=A0A839SYA0_AZOMA|nr:hypothetical protein [Azomonas macrocytogenes]MBB3102327.1 hypothetical protein [Azomonas macrocytogenes]
MADKETIDIEEEFIAESDDDSSDAPIEAAKTNLTKRRVIDNMLEERRLKRQLADYDFDL